MGVVLRGTLFFALRRIAALFRLRFPRACGRMAGMGTPAVMSVVVTAAMVVYLAATRRNANDGKTSRGLCTARIGALPFLVVMLCHMFCFYAWDYEGLLLLAKERAGVEPLRGDSVDCLILIVCYAAWWFFLVVAYARRLHDMGFRFTRALVPQMVVSFLLCKGIVFLLKLCDAPWFIVDSMGSIIAYLALVCAFGSLPSEPRDNEWGEYEGYSTCDPYGWWAFCKMVVTFVVFLAINACVYAVLLGIGEVHASELLNR